ncbi:MAG: NHL repeat-containing protein [Acidiferrobacterales bacterium]
MNTLNPRRRFLMIMPAVLAAFLTACGGGGSSSSGSGSGGSGSGNGSSGGSGSGGSSQTYIAGTNPYGIAIDGAGNVWVTNYGDNTLSKLSSIGAPLGTFVVGTKPDAVAIDGAGNVWVANIGTVSELGPTGAPVNTFGNSGTEDLGGAGIAIDGAGNVWLPNISTISELGPTGALVGTFDTFIFGEHDDRIAIDGAGHIWVTNNSNRPVGTYPQDSNVFELSSTGVFFGTFSAGFEPDAIAIDGSGNVWVANGYDGTVSELSSTGAPLGTYVVGTSPDAIAIDGAGNVWVANAGNGGGTIGTAAGDSNVMELNGSNGALLNTFVAGVDPDGIAIDGSGNVWVANFGGGTTIGTALGDSNVTELIGVASPVKVPLLPHGIAGIVTTLAGKAGTAGSVNGTGTNATFSYPWDVTTDGTNLYVIDAGTGGIRKIVIATGVVTTLTLQNAWAITTDGVNLYVADANNDIIRKIVIATGAVTTFAGQFNVIGHADGTGTAATFYSPKGITTDGTNLYVSDSVNDTIRQIVIATGAVTTLAGTALSQGSTDGTGAAARFYFPQGLTTDGTNLYVADLKNDTIRKLVIATGTVTTLAGTALSQGSTDGTGAAATFNLPLGVTLDGSNLYVSDSGNDTIRQIVIATGAVTTLAGTALSQGSADGTGAAARFNNPRGLTNDGTNLYVTDYGNDTIRQIH